MENRRDFMGTIVKNEPKGGDIRIVQHEFRRGEVINIFLSEKNPVWKMRKVSSRLQDHQYSSRHKYYNKEYNGNNYVPIRIRAKASEPESSYGEESDDDSNLNLEVPAAPMNSPIPSSPAALSENIPAQKLLSEEIGPVVTAVQGSIAAESSPSPISPAMEIKPSFSEYAVKGVKFVLKILAGLLVIGVAAAVIALSWKLIVGLIGIKIAITCFCIAILGFIFLLKTVYKSASSIPENLPYPVAHELEPVRVRAPAPRSAAVSRARVSHSALPNRSGAKHVGKKVRTRVTFNPL